MPEKFILKYLFIVHFADGTSYSQTPDDISKIDPTRSEFYDVLQSGKAITRFSLVSTMDSPPHVVSVDLITGLFEVNGFPILLEGDKLPTHPDKFELVYYRQHTHNINVTYKLKSGEVTDNKEADHFCEYFIGWKCNISGRDYQQKLAVS